MAYTELQDVNATGVSDLLVYTSQIVPALFPLILFGLFLIATLGSYFSQKRLSGTGDFLGSMMVGSFFTTVVTVILALIPGVISTLVLGVVIAITAIIAIVFFTSKDKI